MKAPRLSQRGRQQRPLLSRLLTAFVLCGCALLGLSLYTLSSLYSQQQRAASTANHGSSSTPSVAELYGSAVLPGNSSRVTGPSQLLVRLPELQRTHPLAASSSSLTQAAAPCIALQVLGYYNSGASLLARLLMLMGVFAGPAEQLRIDAANKLRWWELKQVVALNDLMLRKYAAPGLPPRLARGFSSALLDADDADYYADRVEGVSRYLNSHRPWLLKDPRLAWLAPRWLERLEAPLCLLVVHLSPVALGEQLAGFGQQEGDETEVSPATHVERWTNATLSALQACIAVPTIVVPSSVLAPPLLQPFMAVLQQHLQLAGVQGTHLPADALLQQQYVRHLRPGSVARVQPAPGCSAAAAAAGGANATIDGASLLQDSCHWLPRKPGLAPPPPADGSGSSSSKSSSSSSRLPIPTIALLDVLHDHLQAHLANPEAGLDYSKVAGQLFAAYSANVRALVRKQQGPSSVWEHASIKDLIHNALQYVGADSAAQPALFRLRQLRGSNNWRAGLAAA